jgi:hypothetical protein
MCNMPRRRTRSPQRLPAGFVAQLNTAADNLLSSLAERMRTKGKRRGATLGLEAKAHRTSQDRVDPRPVRSDRAQCRPVAARQPGRRPSRLEVGHPLRWAAVGYRGPTTSSALTNPSFQMPAKSRPCCAISNSSPLGIRRPLEFGALWNSAPFGIPRPLEFRALWTGHRSAKETPSHPPGPRQVTARVGR